MTTVFYYIVRKVNSLCELLAAWKGARKLPANVCIMLCAPNSRAVELFNGRSSDQSECRIISSLRFTFTRLLCDDSNFVARWSARLQESNYLRIKIGIWRLESRGLALNVMSARQVIDRDEHFFQLLAAFVRIYTIFCCTMHYDRSSWYATFKLLESNIVFSI
jgi:hypothetical protein